MSNRIRYQKHEHREDCLISVNVFQSQKNGANYRVVLDLKEMKYYIRNERIKVFIAKSKSYGNMNVLKRNARKRLQELGVNLGKKEVRNRTFGICEKGMTQDKWEKDN